MQHDHDRHRPHTGRGRAAAPGRAAERGSSVVELMIATVLAVIAFVAIMSGVLRLHALQRVDEELAHAYRACRSTMEDLRAMPLSDLPALDGTGFEVAGRDGVTPLLRPVAGDPDGLPGFLSVRRERAAGDRELYRVTTSVQWAGAGGDQAVTFTALWGGVP